jgi:DNA (cytosine-5)-methyltransferase 1
MNNKNSSPISAIDLFCGAGGLTSGLRKAGIRVEAGIDVDPQAEFAYATNNKGSKYLPWDVTSLKGDHLQEMFAPDHIRLLAGCAPCRPFSKLTQGIQDHKEFDMLDHFGRLIREILPELMIMENVPELAGRGRQVLDRFEQTLCDEGYQTDSAIVSCEQFGVPQARRRFVLVASRLGSIAIPDGPYRYPSQWKTVKKTFSGLSQLKSGEQDPNDPLHGAALLSEINLKRIQATPPDGGTWKHWPEHLKLACHKTDKGKTYGSIYGRMWWDRPGPTMTTLCTGLGNGRFGHPDQDRAITLREAALLQSFPKSYVFWPPDKPVNRKAVGRMIGNAVPPKLGKVLGRVLVDHVAQYNRSDD